MVTNVKSYVLKNVTNVKTNVKWNVIVRLDAIKNAIKNVLNAKSYVFCDANIQNVLKNAMNNVIDNHAIKNALRHLIVVVNAWDFVEKYVQIFVWIKIIKQSSQLMIQFFIN